MYFVVLLTEKSFKYVDKMKWFSHIYTMFIVIIAWVFFRADNIGDALVYIGNMFGIGATSFVDSVFIGHIKAIALVLIFGVIGMTPCIKNIFVRLRNSKYRMIEMIWIMMLFVLSLLQVIGSSYNPFIYFNF